MTIDEAIIHCEEVAIRKLKNENNAKCVQCGEEHVQLAKWLKELKDYKSMEDVAPIRHSRWIKTADGVECEKCGREAVYQIVDDHWEYEPWCPHCGSIMDAKE